MSQPALYLSIAVIIIGPAFAAFLGYLVARSPDGEEPELVFETRRLYFAAAVLVGLGFLFFEAMILCYYSEVQIGANGNSVNHGKDIFDAAKTILPPIVTLVLGYYFGSTTAKSKKT